MKQIPTDKLNEITNYLFSLVVPVQVGVNLSNIINYLNALQDVVVQNKYEEKINKNK